MIRLLAIVGPTAAGKTAAGVELARRVGGEVVSCDSLAVYRGCDVGTAKPTAAERAIVPHHCLDLVDPDARFSAADYVAEADRAIAGLAARGRPAVVVGGTGLYLQALTAGLFPSPPPDPALRARLRRDAAELGWPALHDRLAIVDPVAAARIAPADAVRIERALEVHAQTGEPISALQARHAAAPRYEARVVVLDPGAALEERIAARARAMIDAGLLDETRALAERHGRAIKALGAVGYKEALACLDGTLPRGDLALAIVRATRRFARRQRTWTRRYLGAAPVVAAVDALPWGELAAFVGARAGAP